MPTPRARSSTAPRDRDTSNLGKPRLPFGLNAGAPRRPADRLCVSEVFEGNE
jgi:hypothetical protein